MKRFILAMAFILCLLPVGVRGAIYYVAPTATGAGDGSAVNAAGTITTILNGVDFADGDVIILKAEVTYATTITLAATIVGNGVTGLTIRGSQSTDGDWGDGTKDEDTAKPLLNGNSAMAVLINATTSFKVANLTFKDIAMKGQQFQATKSTVATFMYINGLVIDGFDGNGFTDWNGLTQGKNAVDITSCKGAIEVKNCYLQNYGPIAGANGPVLDIDGSDRDYLILYTSLLNTAGTTVSINNNTIKNANADCIQLAKSNAVAYDIYENVLLNAGENAIDVKGVDNVTIRNNEIGRSSFTGVLSGHQANMVHIHPYGDYGWDTQNITVKDNYFYDLDLHSAVAVFGQTYGGVTYWPINVYVYRNKFDNVPRALSMTNYADNLLFYRNVILDTPITGDWVFFNHASGYTPASGGGTKIYNNTFVANSQIARGVYADRGEYVLLKNNVFYVTYNGTVYLVDCIDTVKASYIDNIFINATAGNQDIINWNGTPYDESELAAWETAGGVTVASNAFADPGLSDIANDLLYAASAASAIINTGADVSSEIANSVNGLKNVATWGTGAWTSDDTVSSINNGGYDRGAYELLEEEAPAPVDGAAPTGTYLIAWNGDYTDDVSMAWDDSGAGTHDGTVAAGVEITGDYGVTGNGARFSVADENIEWTDTAGDSVNTSEGTVWVSLLAEASTANNEFFHIYVDGNDEIYAYLTSDGTVTLVHAGGNGASVVRVSTSAGAIVDNTRHTVGLRWSVTNNVTGIKVDSADWVDDNDNNVVTALSAGTRYVMIGESSRSTAVGLTNPITIDNFSISGAYNQAIPDWTPSDSTAPTITARGVCSDASCTACTTDLTDAWGAETVRVCAALSEDVIVTVPPAWQMDCGPVSGDKVTGSYFQKIDIGGTKYLTAQFTFTDRMRFSDPQLYEMTGGTIQDGSGNDLDTTGSAGDISSGTLTIGVAGSFSLGTFSGLDEDGNAITWGGEYSTMTALKAAFSILAGDHFTLGAVTEPPDLDLSGDDCTEEAPCGITLTGDWTQAGAGLTMGDWWTITGAGNEISGAFTGGANNVIQRVEFK